MKARLLNLLTFQTLFGHELRKKITCPKQERNRRIVQTQAMVRILDMMNQCAVVKLTKVLFTVPRVKTQSNQNRQRYIEKCFGLVFEGVGNSRPW